MINNVLLLAEKSGWTNFWWMPVGLIIGLIVGFFVSRAVFAKQLKKNPPVNEKMIRAMFLSMGRKPSEAQIKQVMKSMDQNR